MNIPDQIALASATHPFATWFRLVLLEVVLHAATALGFLRNDGRLHGFTFWK